MGIDTLRLAADKLAKQGVRVTLLDHDQDTIKWGRNPDCDSGVAETIWNTGSEETLATTNAIDQISSSDNADTTVITLVGHTLAAGDFSRVTQTVTLTGQTAATLTTPLARVERGFTSSGTAFAGDVYVWESGGGSTAGVPDVAADIHLTMRAAAQQSEKCAFTVPADEYAVLVETHAEVVGNATAIANIELQTRDRAVGVWRTRFEFDARGAGNPTPFSFPVPFLVSPNHDVRLRSTANSNNQVVTGSIQAVFGKII